MENGGIEKYCDIMDEIKRRIAVVDSFSDGFSSALYQAANIESCYLQLRKILELIAFGSLVANKREFGAVFREYSKYWNAKKLLKDLASINNNFYPQPIIESNGSKNGIKSDWIDKKDGFLTHNDFIVLYGKCSEVIHSRNPYAADIDYVNYHSEIIPWRTKIIELLNSHTIKLSNDKSLYLIHMKEDRDDKVHAYTFSPMRPV